MLLVSCGAPGADRVAQKNLSITKYSEERGWYYEETTSGFKSTFYTTDDIEVERIKDWVDECRPTSKYYQYIYSDPDSWDLFICFPFEDEIVCNSLNSVLKIVLLRYILRTTKILNIINKPVRFLFVFKHLPEGYGHRHQNYI